MISQGAGVEPHIGCSFKSFGFQKARSLCTNDSIDHNMCVCGNFIIWKNCLNLSVNLHNLKGEDDTSTNRGEKIIRFYRDLNSDRRIQSPEC